MTIVSSCCLTNKLGMRVTMRQQFDYLKTAVNQVQF